MKHFGIIGWGYWGRNYAKYINPTIGATLDFVCDLRDEMLVDAKTLYPHFQVTKDFNDLIKNKLDGVIIATPASLHYRVAKPLLEAGMNVLIEKPVTNNVDQAIELQEIAQKNNAKILVGHTFLYNQSVMWLKQKIDEGYFGKVYHIECKRQSYGPIRDDVNIIWDFAPHDIAIANYWLGSMPQSVSVQAGTFSRHDKEDIAIITLRYPNNVMVSISVAWLYPIKIRTVTLLGDQKMAVFEDTDQQNPVKVYDTAITYPSESDKYGAAFRVGDMIVPRIAQGDPLLHEIKQFIAYIDGKNVPVSPIENGIEVVRVLEAIDTAMKTKTEVTL